MNEMSVHVKRGDTVLVKIGRELDRGKTGKVLRVFPRKGKIIVEGINVIKKTVKASQNNPKGGFTEREFPINASRVRLVCPACGKTTRLAHRMLEDKKYRYCKKCDATIEDQL